MSCLLLATSILSGCASSDPKISPTSTFGITPQVAVVVTGQSVQFAPTGDTGSLVNLSWMVNGTVGGSADTGTITSGGTYTAPASASGTTQVLISAMNTVNNVTSSAAQVSFFPENKFPAGAVSSSNNPQVAEYSLLEPEGASAQVQFGTTTSYGLTTWVQPAPPAGGIVDVLVAGMRANTTYHMQATTTLSSGQQIVDADHSFTTGNLPASLIPNLTIPQAAGTGTAPGIELLNILNLNATTLLALATDLSGNVIWYYPLDPGVVPFPIKLLPNGHMLVVLNGAEGAVREIDLAGNILYQLSIADIDNGLTAIGVPIQVANIHHDIVKLPNGHLILLVNFTKTFTDQPGFSTVTGDALIDWDTKANVPVWTWSTFDHIPLTHDPFGPTDWSHANAVVYSPDDGNLILSMRNQNWVVKINYQDGAGDGKILWHLGPGGDFTLPNGQAPIEWNYGQHYPTVVTPNSAGIFQLMFFNNGNNRLVDAANDVCETAGQIACYSSVPILELNESANTAQVVSEINLSPHYSICCGNASRLVNGDIEYDVALDVNTPNTSFVQEVVPETSPQLVWQMNLNGQLLYRGFRIPSLYPGVQWTDAAITAANAPAVVKQNSHKANGSR